jgi:hypothetical protein
VCLQCSEPMCEIEGRFSGRSYTIEGSGEVHSECHTAFKNAAAIHRRRDELAPCI